MIAPTRALPIAGLPAAPLAALFAAWLAVPAPFAAAQALSGAVGLSSEQVLRGVSISNGAASLSLDANLRSDTGWGAGLGLATLGRDAQGRRTLLSASAWRSWQLDAGWTAQFGAAHYAYPGGSQRRRFDYDELSASVGWQGRVAAAIAVLPNTSRRGADGVAHRGRAIACELSLHQRLAGPLALDAGIGWMDLRAIDAGYPYGSVGVSAAVGPLQVVGSYIASRAEARGLAAAGAGGDRWLLSLLWDF